MQRSDYPRVTDVISAWTYKKFSEIPQHFLDGAKERGSTVDAWCANYVKQLYNPEIPEKYKPYCEAFKAWWDENVITVHAVQERKYSDEHEYQGEPDFEVLIKELGDAILDVKCSFTTNHSWAVQLSGYWGLCSPRKLYNLHLKKKKKEITNAQGEIIVPAQVEAILIPQPLIWDVYYSALTCYKYFEVENV
jgi:hypothetical protein